MTAKIRRAASLRPGQFKHFIRVASVTGRMPELKRRGIDLRIICEILGIEILMRLENSVQVILRGWAT